jgi:DNA segregation ATPase FtsK/SpoIIIE, S-DNA-T family
MRTTSFSIIDYLPESVREFPKRRAAELTGVSILSGVGAMSLALLTWSVEDPSLNHATSTAIHNLLGAPGAIAADIAMQSMGLSCVVALTPPAFWGWRLVTHRRLERARARCALWIAGSIASAGLASFLPAPTRWPLPTGLGGVLGDAVLWIPGHFFANSTSGMLIVGLSLAGVAILTLTAAAGFGLMPTHDDDGIDAKAKTFAAPRRPMEEPIDNEDDDSSGEPGFGLVSLGAAIHVALTARSAMRRLFAAKKRAGEPGSAPPRAPWLNRQGGAFAADDEDSVAPRTPRRVDPSFGPATTGYGSAPAVAIAGGASRVAAPAGALKQGKRIVSEAQPSLLDRMNYQLPPLFMLAEPKKLVATKISEDALEQNARLLEGVLDDFGVKGEIINVRPGPVVTLYELEPAPGIKSSRVIGLADDIARSMSAISARVAVVQGRNAIGIELPNQRRETVYLRELLASQDFEKSKHRLPIALGKTIGGEPVIVDLARMPHLLVAGTTGSGKSVAINTMILSLLYRLKPEQCRLIMVDPKMLELSVYDGIPHLLTPVVTDPKKAVVALKWAVREMEDRYKKMSKVGVRNIDGFNARVAEAAAKGEVITRTVQTGFDRQTGEAIYEQEEMELSELPYIVVIVDEMGDPAPGANGARRRHPPHHGHAASLRGCDHWNHQGQFPDPHLVPGDIEDRQPHDPWRAGRRTAPWPGRHALYGRRRAHLARPRPLRRRQRGRKDRDPSEGSGPTGISERHYRRRPRRRRGRRGRRSHRFARLDGCGGSGRLLRPGRQHRAARPQMFDQLYPAPPFGRLQQGGLVGRTDGERGGRRRRQSFGQTRNPDRRGRRPGRLLD